MVAKYLSHTGLYDSAMYPRSQNIPGFLADEIPVQGLSFSIGLYLGPHKQRATQHLHIIGRAESPNYRHYSHPTDEGERITFHCPRYLRQRRELLMRRDRPTNLEER